MKERIKIILLALFLLPNIVSAKDIYQYKYNLKIDGTYNSSTFFAGEKISSEADLNGISFMMGSTIDVDGKIDYIASMGEDITIYGDIKNDAFLLSSKISINGNLKRDAYMLADSIYIDGKINRNIYAYANKLKLENATINGNVYLRASEVVVGENVKIKGKLTINENAIITEDNGMITLLKNSQIDILKIEGGFIKLSDRHTGFLGGASGKIGKNKIFFNGNLEEHPSYQEIINFLDLYNVKPFYDKSYKLTDIGSIIPITEKI